ncbi:MAG: 3-hydroxyacyl-ACP dehydratase [Polaromonas sp.]
MNGETSLFIAPDHPAFAGHFPEMPILPGVVLLDAVVHAVSHVQGITTSCQISSAKFLSPVGPGETLVISWSRSAAGGMRFDISSGARKVATGALAFSLVP